MEGPRRLAATGIARQAGEWPGAARSGRDVGGSADRVVGGSGDEAGLASRESSLAGLESSLREDEQSLGRSEKGFAGGQRVQGDSRRDRARPTG